MDLSLIVATVGRTEELRRLVGSLEAQNSRGFELIVIDQNNDRRNEGAIARARDAGLRVTHEMVGMLGLSAARNVGLRLACGELVGFPDDDCWYEPTVVSSVVAALSDCGIDGIVGRWVELSPLECEARLLSERRMRSFREIACSSIVQFHRRNIVRDIGGFDARLGLPNWFGAGEDTDLVLRLLRCGCRLEYRPDVLIHHELRRESPADRTESGRKALRSRARGTGALYAKHRLSPYVVARGVVAPIICGLLRPISVSKAVDGLAVGAGRIEGMYSWLKDKTLRGRHRC